VTYTEFWQVDFPYQKSQSFVTGFFCCLGYHLMKRNEYALFNARFDQLLESIPVGCANYRISHHAGLRLEIPTGGNIGKTARWFFCQRDGSFCTSIFGCITASITAIKYHISGKYDTRNFHYSASPVCVLLSCTPSKTKK
jgi:hypothetical protein